jgi:hypothetical protein
MRTEPLIEPKSEPLFINRVELAPVVFATNIPKISEAEQNVRKSHGSADPLPTRLRQSPGHRKLRTISLKMRLKFRILMAFLTLAAQRSIALVRASARDQPRIADCR